MIIRLWVLLSALFCASITLAASDPAAPAPPTIEELFRPAYFGETQLSPDGKYLAAIYADENDQRHLRVIDLAAGKVSDLGCYSGYEISWFGWLGSDRIVYNVHKDTVLTFGLFVVKASDLRESHPIDLYDSVSVIGFPRSRPGHVLAWIDQSARRNGMDGGLVEIDAARSEMSDFNQIQLGDAVVRTYPSPPSGTVAGWKCDFDGELAFCSTYENGHSHIFRYQNAHRTWQEVRMRHLDDFFAPSLDPDGRHIWITTTYDDAKKGTVLHRYNLDSRKYEKAIFQDLSYNLSDCVPFFSRQTRQLAGFTYEQRHRHNVWFDKRFADIQAAVDQDFPQCDNVLVSFDENERHFLFRVTSDRQPGLYVLFDRQQNTIFRVTEMAPWLDGKRLATTQPIAFRTRDGVQLEGYLTLPPGASKAHPPPLVVLPHGGPWVRDIWTFNSEVQFLAGRGYAVLQPNYRGSTGYSNEISRTHKFDFRLMCNDITDATHVMQHSGLIDPTHMAIMGSSFGGYLSLAGVAFEPDLYRCAVSLAGVFDWEEQIKEKRWDDQDVAYEYLRDRLGQPGTDRAQFDEISPLAHAAQIHVPVFIAHGLDDRVVSVHQSRLIASALEKHGVPHETFYRNFEPHGFYDYQDRVDYYKAVDAFLAKYLAPKPAGASLAAAK